MKKILFFLIVFFIPFMVYAKEDVSLKDLVLKKTTGYTEVLNDAEIINNKIVLDLKMYEVGDSVEYQFTVKNNTSKDYQLDPNNLINSNTTVEYEIIGEGNSNLIEKNHQKKFTLIVTYKNEVDKTLFKAGKYDSSSKLIYELKEHHLINPETGSFFLTILFIILFVTIGFMKLNINKIRTYLLLSLFLIPFSVFALEEYKIELESNIIIGYVTPNPCTYDGELTPGAEYTNGQYTYRYMQEYGYNSSTSSYEWQNIDNDGWGVHLSDPTSTEPVTTKLCTSINDKPIVTMFNMFNGSKTTNIDTSSFNTSNVTNMTGMFANCSSLTDIDVTEFDTSNVTNMSGMFASCSRITDIDVTKFDTSNVTNMSGMFSGCSGLEELDLSGFDFSNYNPGSLMMNVSGGGFSSLKILNMTGAKLPSNLNYAFGGLSTVEQIILDDVDTSLATTMEAMFFNSSKLTSLDLSSFNTSNVTRMNAMFLSCSSLTNIDVSNFNTSSVTTMQSMFNGCISLLDIDVSNFDTSNVTFMDAMFYGCSSLTTSDFSNFDTSKVTNMGSMFYGCSSLTELDLSGFNFSNYNPGYLMMNVSGGGFSSLKTLNMTDVKLPSNLNYAFGGLSTVEQIILDDVDTSLATTMESMFNGSSKLTSLDLSSFDTSRVTTMEKMFYGCSSLTTLDLSSFNTSNVTKMAAMFYGCSGLEELDLSGFDFSNYNPGSLMMNVSGGGFSSLKVLNMTGAKLPSNCTYAFGGLGTVETIIFDNTDTSSVTTMQAMFYGCSGLTGLDFSSFDTSNVTNMYDMFNNCCSLTTLDLSNFNISSSVDVYNIFYNCLILNKVYAKNQTITDLLNNSIGKPSNVNVVVKV